MMENKELENLSPETKNYLSNRMNLSFIFGIAVGMGFFLFVYAILNSELL